MEYSGTENDEITFVDVENDTSKRFEYLLQEFMKGGKMKSKGNDHMVQLYFHAILGAYLKNYTVVKSGGMSDLRCPIVWIQNSGCLDENTLIETKRGNVPIKELTEHDYVKSYNFDTQKEEWSNVLVFDTGDKEIYQIEMEDGRTLLATEEHVFFNENGDEVKVSELKVGDELYSKK